MPGFTRIAAVGALAVAALGRQSANDWTASGATSGAQFGAQVAGAGDVNGDGFGDLLVVEPGTYAQPDDARAYLFLGSASGPGSTPNWTTGPLPDGVCAASAGDVNGDGFDDVIVGNPGYVNPAGVRTGRALVYAGGANGPSSAPNWILNRNVAGYFGGVASAGDIDRDGFDDVLVADPSYDGEVFVYHGSSAGLSNVPRLVLVGNSASAAFGTCVASAGDVNRDGFGDVIVGAPFANNNVGKAFVFLGSASGLSASPAWNATGVDPNGWFGLSVASAGDVNGDRFDDIVVGAPNAGGAFSGSGRVRVYLGASNGVSPVHVWSASGWSYAGFGFCVSSAGDVNGDGYGDIVVGGPSFSYGQDEEGQAQVYLGSGAGPAIVATWAVQGGADLVHYGHSVACAGDVNGDNRSDVLVSAPDHGTGRAYLYFHAFTCGEVDTLCASTMSSTGCAAVLSTSGAPSATATSGFVLTVAGAEASTQGIVFYGISDQLNWSAPFGASTLCVRAPHQRMGLQVASGTAGACNGTITADWNSFIASNAAALGVPFQGYEHVHVQAWLRDPGDAHGGVLTNAVVFYPCP